MENNHKPPDHSNKILGQLYDRVKQFQEVLKSEQQQNIQQTDSFLPYHLLFIDGFDSYISAARITKYEYDSELKQLIRQYGIHNEVQLVSGYIVKFTSRQYAKKQTKIYDLQKEIAHAVRVIQDK